jgi:hypothetical protein
MSVTVRYLWLFLAVSVIFAGPRLVQAETIGWQEAVARLAHERTRAETCTRLLKRHADEAAVSRGELAYGESKAEVDAVIAGLVVALAKDSEPPSLPDLEGRLERGVKGREAICEQAAALLPDTVGERSLIIPLLVAALPPLILAFKEIYLEGPEQDRLTQETIRTQLEATTWPAFAAIEP